MAMIRGNKTSWQSDVFKSIIFIVTKVWQLSNSAFDEIKDSVLFGDSFMAYLGIAKLLINKKNMIILHVRFLNKKGNEKFIKMYN